MRNGKYLVRNDKSELLNQPSQLPTLLLFKPIRTDVPISCDQTLSWFNPSQMTLIGV